MRRVRNSWPCFFPWAFIGNFAAAAEAPPTEAEVEAMEQADAFPRTAFYDASTTTCR
ncbi:MAG TPA: hypothetical protein VMJ74_16800 [Pseudomonadales bacterium]|nr:hypothetical protein [Pseudomonadales bacterium]